ncbi:hypothetical protein [Deinococcus frigens]|uniref:hypothetical protein n=1 Tax=Deinococcus frigens TaxID=249403 RepID=UPI0012ECA7BE|nr:hypothetical protein [Deinococcus frigens]
MDEQAEWGRGDAGVTASLNGEEVDSTVLIAIVGLLGVLLGALINLVQSLVSNHYALKRELAQWNREDKNKEVGLILEKENKREEKVAIALIRSLSAMSEFQQTYYRYDELEKVEGLELAA